MAHSSPLARDFSAKVLRDLTARGVAIYGATVIPGEGDLPFATGERGYKVNDNGCGRVWTYAEVIKAAA